MSTPLVATNRDNYSSDQTVLPGIQRIDGTVTAEPPLLASGVEGALSFSTTPVIAKVGASNLTDRILLTIHALSNGIYWGYTASVSASTGTPLSNGDFLTLEAGSSCNIYLVGNSGTKNVRITEGAK